MKDRKWETEWVKQNNAHLKLDETRIHTMFESYMLGFDNVTGKRSGDYDGWYINKELSEIKQ